MACYAFRCIDARPQVLDAFPLVFSWFCFYNEYVAFHGERHIPTGRWDDMRRLALHRCAPTRARWSFHLSAVPDGEKRLITTYPQSCLLGLKVSEEYVAFHGERHIGSDRWGEMRSLGLFRRGWLGVGGKRSGDAERRRGTRVWWRRSRHQRMASRARVKTQPGSP